MRRKVKGRERKAETDRGKYFQPAEHTLKLGGTKNIIVPRAKARIHWKTNQSKDKRKTNQSKGGRKTSQSQGEREIAVPCAAVGKLKTVSFSKTDIAILQRTV